MASWQALIVLLLTCIKGLYADCSAGELPPSATESPTVGRWALNDDHPSSCPGKLTQYEIYHYNDGGEVYLALWTPLGNNDYELVEGSLKQVSISGSGGGSYTATVNQFVYIPSGSVVGAYVPSNDHLQVVGYVWLTNDYGLCGNTNSDENATTLSCSSGGTIGWTRLHVEASIETVDCGSLANINNGYVSLLNDSTLYGSVAQYQCNVTGYILNGNEKRFCSKDETWNGTEPFCELFNCTVPSIGNGMIHGNIFTYGSSISYTCNEGYTLTGDSVITCGSDMTWNGSAVCDPVNCDDPGTPINGSQTAEDGFKYQSIVSFNCNSGYNLIGSSSIECLSNSTWNTSVPVCDPVNCGDPGTPDNGEKNSMTYTYSSTIIFSCHTGYSLTTSYSSIICETDGSWSDPTPNCIPVSCEAPPILMNGSFNESTDNTYTFMTSVVYQCDEGFILNGSSTITCMADKEWSGGAPECLRGCNNFDLTNGVVDQSMGPFIVGVVVHLSCMSGYQLNINESVIECLSTGEWNFTSTPGCIEVFESSSPSMMPHTSTMLLSSSISTESSMTVSVIVSTSIKQTADTMSASLTQVFSSSSQVFVTSNVIPSSSSQSQSLIISQPTSQSKMASTSSKPTIDLQPSTSLSKLSAHQTTSDTSSSTLMNTIIATSTVTQNATTVNEPDSSSPTGLYSGIAAGAFIVLLVVALVIVFIALVVLKKKFDKGKKYTVSGNNNENHINPMVMSELYGQTGTTASSIRYKPSGETVEFVEPPLTSASTYEDPISTLQRSTVVNEEEYNYLSSATVGDSEAGMTYEDPISTLGRAGGTVCIDSHQNSVSYKSPHQQSSNTENHTNQLYMDVDEEDSKRDLTVEDVVYASNDDDEIPVPDVTLALPPLPPPLEDSDITGLDSTYASNDDPPLTGGLETYLQFSEGTITNKPAAPTVRYSGSMRNEVPSSVNESAANQRSATTYNNKRMTAIYEAPASQVVELVAQLRRRNVKLIPKKQLNIADTLGSGFYGKVYKAAYTYKPTNVMDVAVKTLQGDNISDKERANFLKEAVVMSQFKHTNVLRLHGMVLESSQDCMIVTEIMDKGDLKQLLAKLRPDPGELGGTEELSHLLLNFSRQVCMGLTYLSEKGFVHRDIAARNVLVNVKNVCKIADFGLSRDLEEDNYYTANKEAKVPIKWTAPEALHYRKYSSASDVWSYGCLLYEIWSLGLSPFTGVTNIESLRRVERGYRLPPPPGCPHPVYEIMIKCWHPNAKQRQRFNDIMLGLLQKDSVILCIPEEELSKAADSQAGVIGANLKAGEKLYDNLQQTYVNM